jgi:hypothetical protein
MELVEGSKPPQGPIPLQPCLEDRLSLDTSPLIQRRAESGLSASIFFIKRTIPEFEKGYEFNKMPLEELIPRGSRGRYAASHGSRGNRPRHRPAALY